MSDETEKPAPDFSQKIWGEQRKALCEKYLRFPHVTTRQLGEEFGITHARVAQILDEEGIPRRPRGNLSEDRRKALYEDERPKRRPRAA